MQRGAAAAGRGPPTTDSPAPGREGGVEGTGTQPPVAGTGEAGPALPGPAAGQPARRGVAGGGRLARGGKRGSGRAGDTQHNRQKRANNAAEVGSAAGTRVGRR